MFLVIYQLKSKFGEWKEISIFELRISSIWITFQLKFHSNRTEKWSIFVDLLRLWAEGVSKRSSILNQLLNVCCISFSLLFSSSYYEFETKENSNRKSKIELQKYWLNTFHAVCFGSSFFSHFTTTQTRLSCFPSNVLSCLHAILALNLRFWIFLLGFFIFLNFFCFKSMVFHVCFSLPSRLS